MWRQINTDSWSLTLQTLHQISFIESIRVNLSKTWPVSLFLKMFRDCELRVSGGTLFHKTAAEISNALPSWLLCAGIKIAFVLLPLVLARPSTLLRRLNMSDM